MLLVVRVIGQGGDMAIHYGGGGQLVGATRAQ